MKHWLEDIYRDHRRGLLALAVSVVREVAAAEDAVHEAFVRMAKQTTPPTGDPAAYAYRAVRNAAIDQTRRRETRPTPTDDMATLFAAPHTDDPSYASETRETQQMLMQAVDNLPDLEREIVVLRSFGGLTFKQIAEATDQPISTISSQHKRALDKLRHALEKDHATT